MRPCGRDIWRKGAAGPVDEVSYSASLVSGSFWEGIEKKR